MAKNFLPNGGQHGYGLLLSDKSSDLIYSNTFYENGVEIQQIGHGSEELPSRFIDNIFWGLAPARVVIPPTALVAGDVFSTNDYFHALPPASERRAFSLDPRFLAAGSDFRLRRHSPLRGLGQRLRLPTRCSSIDLGAEPFRITPRCHPAPTAV